ncbi:MAG: tetratricopeptide repeat protein [Rhodobacteraceae bacterium]|nr:tetratricopeptide repeat protein [Paracoccaceae bacterium]
MKTVGLSGEFTPLAGQGRLGAQYILGFMYNYDEGVQVDPMQAFVWFSLAAGKGEERRVGVASDLQDEIRELMARDQVTEAQYSVGTMYAKGDGTPVEEFRAHTWSVLAEEHGHRTAGMELDRLSGLLSRDQIAEAQHCVGRIYEDAIGVHEDALEAIAWFRKATEDGFANAQYDLGWHDYGHGRSRTSLCLVQSRGERFP